jgi:hypothetical protein
MHDQEPPKPNGDPVIGASQPNPCSCGEGGYCAHHGSGLLADRRKFLIGSVGLSAFAATLASRPAFAGQSQNGGCGPLTALCSPTHSGTQKTASCVGYHCDYWCTNKSAWPVDCRTPLSSCFPGISFTGCDQTFQQALCSAYTQSSQHGGHYGYYSMTNFSNQWGSGYYQKSGAYYNYMTTCNTTNIACWLAAGYCNAASPYTNNSFCYDKKSFVNACATALQSRCYSNVEHIICQTVSSVCNVGRQTNGCGPSPNNWVGSW